MSKNTNFSFLFLFLFLFLFSIFLQISFCVATNESYQQDDNNDDSDDVDNGVLSQEAANPSKSFGKTFDNDKNKNDNTNSNTLIRDTISSSTNPIKINNPNIGIPETISSLQSPSQTPTGTTLIESNTASASSSLTSSSTQFPNEFQERPTPKKLGNHQFCFRFLNNTKHDFSEYQYFQYRFQFLYESKNRIQSHSFFTAWNHISVSFIVKDAVGTHFRLYLKGEGELSEGGSGNAYNVLVSYFEKTQIVQCYFIHLNGFTLKECMTTLLSKFVENHVI